MQSKIFSHKESDKADLDISVLEMLRHPWAPRVYHGQESLGVKTLTEGRQGVQQGCYAPRTAKSNDGEHSSTVKLDVRCEVEVKK